MRSLRRDETTSICPSPTSTIGMRTGDAGGAMNTKEKARKRELAMEATDPSLARVHRQVAPSSGLRRRGSISGSGSDIRNGV